MEYGKGKSFIAFVKIAFRLASGPIDAEDKFAPTPRRAIGI